MKLLMAARHRLEISYRPLTPWVDPDRMTEKCLMVFSVCCAPARNGVIYPVDMFLGRRCMTGSASGVTTVLFLSGSFSLAAQIA